MLLLAVLLPFFNGCVLGLAGRWISVRGSQILTSLTLSGSAGMSLINLYEVLNFAQPCNLQLFTALDCFNLSVEWGLTNDAPTAMVTALVCFISLLVHIYSFEYMRDDPHFIRFFVFLGLFTFFMLVLVTGANLLQLFLGWEGVGLFSFLLVGFWFTRTQANTSALKALMVNRVGDWGFIIGLVGFAGFYRFTDFSASPFLSFSNEVVVIVKWVLSFEDLIAVCLFIGVLSKSAQIGLHTWLPDAMEGPTPVSALIHAATMVAAGVFLLVKGCQIFSSSSVIPTVLLVVGGLTAFCFSLVGLFQYDIKKIVAYSTCSQLGYMVAAAGSMFFPLALFHLINHAFFKALLFLTCGSIIHALHDNQDIRRFGGLILFLPFSYTTFIIGSVALSGFPYFSGFYSKEAIFERLLTLDSNYSCFTYYLLLLAAFFTAAYSSRLVYFVFFNAINFPKNLVNGIFEPKFFMSFSLLLLALFSIFFGYFAKDLFCPQTLVLSNGVSNFASFNIDGEFLPPFKKLYPVGATLLGVSFGFYFSFYQTAILVELRQFKFFRSFFSFFSKKFLFDVLINFYTSAKLFYFSYFWLFKRIEKGVLENILIFLPSKMVYLCGLLPRWLQAGTVHHYQTVMLYFFILLVLVSSGGKIFTFNVPSTVSVFPVLCLVLTSFRVRDGINENLILQAPRFYIIRLIMFFQLRVKRYVGPILYMIAAFGVFFICSISAFGVYIFYFKHGALPSVGGKISFLEFIKISNLWQ